MQEKTLEGSDALLTLSLYVYWPELDCYCAHRAYKFSPVHSFAHSVIC